MMSMSLQQLKLKQQWRHKENPEVTLKKEEEQKKPDQPE